MIIWSASTLVTNAVTKQAIQQYVLCSNSYVAKGAKKLIESKVSTLVSDSTAILFQKMLGTSSLKHVQFKDSYMIFVFKKEVGASLEK